VTGTVLSVDLGGTNMRAAVVEPDGQVTLRVSEPTPHDAPCPAALELLMRSVRDRGGGRGTFGTIVIGVPGRVNYRAGHLEHAPNLPVGWAGELTEAKLAVHFDAPVFLANDADLAAVGESYFGAGRSFTDVVYITISTGIGAGVVFDGRLVRGTRSLAEIGHTVIALDRLAAGEPSTAELLGAGRALERYANAAGIAARGAELVELVRSGDAEARSAWDRTICASATAVVNLTHVFSPDVIVIGGGVGRNGALVIEPVAAMVERHGPRGLDQPIVVLSATLGDDPGLVGAAAWPRAIGRR